MKQDTTLTHIDHAALEHMANRLRNEEIARIAVLIASALGRAASRASAWVRRRVQGSPARPALHAR